MSVEFVSEKIIFELENKKRLSIWVTNCISNEGQIIGDITYIFCSDIYLHKINLEHLGHDTYTDIVTFDYCYDNVVSSDLFISIDRVIDNAKTYSTSFEEELCRVLIHGILHLLGYNDKTKAEQLTMRAKEDFYLTLLQ